ncbi:hypothetical protein [Actinomadura parmotrematis]|uniref:Uncharacterized protein n=1 Tax=Actinomadura parmotrematis TaxID=2864039 RepID=A0ABS7FUG3_9ACTN|nr:hypothetical protein [Actinomadura parmotrematis]MBW8483961.1 hypothetical protein [Actinomadura parmotrematis]
MRKLLVAAAVLAALAGIGLGQAGPARERSAGCPDTGRDGSSRWARAVDRVTDAMGQTLAAGGRPGLCERPGRPDGPVAPRPGAARA